MILENDAKFPKNYKKVFKILKGLSKFGDSEVKNVFKEESAKRFES